VEQQFDPVDLKYYRSLDWVFQIWQPSPALIEKKGGGNARLYVGQNFDPKSFDLVEDGWNHDHCEICYETLCDNPESCQTEGYTADHQWLCRKCYGNLFQDSDNLKT
jgi:hypothetical protein